MSYATSGRVFEVYKTFCESVWLDWVSSKVSAQGANREIEEKRNALESRHGIKLRPYAVSAPL